MSEPEPQATPEQEAQVRRLLARARHDEPVPDHVAARLDQALAGLVAEARAGAPPPPPPTGAEVVDLAARRRRRVTGLLVAAAAVVAVGVGLGQVIDSGDDDSGDADASSAGSALDQENELGRGAADSPAERDDGAQNNEAVPPAPAATSSDAPSAPVEPSQGSIKPPVLAMDEDDFQDLARTFQGIGGVPSRPGQRVEADQLTADSAFVCPPAAYGEGELVAVRYDGSPAVLAYRPPAGQTQIVELLRCGSADVFRSLTLPTE
ncbi:hypothetical protein GCM10023340_00990 [Nocardioides marinquilinus]|uniref:Uncharacterized protein n=1 Tax=Nocardioides marinquilinus TaxID=1210400 RepID=A0ABP9P4M4_9ACTN